MSVALLSQPKKSEFFVTQPSSCNVFNKRDDNRTAKNEGPKQLNPCLSYLMSRDQRLGSSIHPFFLEEIRGDGWIFLLRKQLLLFVMK